MRKAKTRRGRAAGRHRDRTVDGRTPARRRRRLERSVVFSDLMLEDAPLLSAEEEMLLGSRIKNGLARLDRLVRRHPTGITAILERLRDVCEKTIQVYAWFHLKESHRPDLHRASQCLETARLLVDRQPKRARKLFDRAAETLEKYPLEPETLAEIAHQVVEFGETDSLAEVCGGTRLVDVVGRVVGRLEGDRDRFVLGNQKLVAKEVARYQPFGMDRADLYQEGVLGLGKAAYRYDADRELRFSTYATYWIRQTMRKSLVDKSRMIRVPQAVQLQLAKGRREGGLPDDEATRIRRVMNQTVLFSHASNDESGDDFAIDWNGTTSAETSTALHVDAIPAAVHETLAGLGEREKYVLEHRFGIGDSERMTLEEIGAVLHLSRERIRQIEQETLRRLRGSSGLEEVYEALVAEESAGAA